MVRLSFDLVDDPELDFETARIDAGRFLMEGWIDSAGFGVHRRPLGKHRVVMSASHVHGFTVNDQAGAGVLIPETVAFTEHRVIMTGIIPATLVLQTSERADVVFDVEESPFEIRRRRRWVPV